MGVERIGAGLQGTLAEAPQGRVADSAVTELTVAALATITGRLQSRVQRHGEPGPVTQDLLIGELAGLEEQQWMFSAQQG